MNLNQFTQKSVEAVQAAQQMASARQNQQIEQEHLLLALLEQKEGLIPQLMQKAGVEPAALRQKLTAAVERLPQVSGSGAGQMYLSRDLEQALNEAEKIAREMHDEYTSVEHLMLGLFEKTDDALRSLFREAGLTKEKFMAALRQVRGNRTVTSDTPEETYDVLKKYGEPSKINVFEERGLYRYIYGIQESNQKPFVIEHSQMFTVVFYSENDIVQGVRVVYNTLND